MPGFLKSLFGRGKKDGSKAQKLTAKMDGNEAQELTAEQAVKILSSLPREQRKKAMEELLEFEGKRLGGTNEFWILQKLLEEKDLEEKENIDYE